jgi:hypothetical protein
MKIIEALKKLKVIEKRMEKNRTQITQYASMVSIERPVFNTEENQKKEVASLIQSNNDLLKEYLELKGKVEKTNFTFKVEMGGIQYSISDLLIIKRKLAKVMMATYEALNNSAGQSRLRNVSIGAGERSPQVVLFYDEKDKIAGLDRWQDLYNNIDSRLEVINATTDLVD